MRQASSFILARLGKYLDILCFRRSPYLVCGQTEFGGLFCLEQSQKSDVDILRNCSHNRSIKAYL